MMYEIGKYMARISEGSSADSSRYTITDIYMDNIFEALKMDEEIKERKEKMGKELEIKDVEENEYFFGMQVQQDIGLGTIQLTQCPYLVIGKGMDNPVGCQIGVSRVEVRIAPFAPSENPDPEDRL